jgi:hypothetical protein
MSSILIILILFDFSDSIAIDFTFIKIYEIEDLSRPRFLSHT